MKPLRLVVVDDQELVRAGIVALMNSSPDLEVVGDAGRGDDAVRIVRSLVPDVVLMDVRMPVMDGIEATRRITADPACAGTRVVVLTTFGLDEYVFGALRAGATGFVLKHAPPEELLQAVRVAARGEALLSPAITRRLVEVFAKAPPAGADTRLTLPELTQRERDVLALVAQGLSNADIAANLYIGQATVKTYVSRLLSKLAVPDRVHLVICAYQSGIVADGSAPND